MQINMEYIRAQLQRRAGERQLTRVAQECGLTVRTLQRIAKEGNCTTKNAEKVQQFLLDTEKQKKLGYVNQ